MVGKTRHQFIVDGVNDTERLFGTLRRDLKQTDNRAAQLRATLAGIGAGIAAGLGGARLVSTLREFETLKASLTTVTGSSEAARQAFEWIEEFAATTPFQLNEIVDGFVKLTALGLEPSREALESYGNTASAMGKSLNQFIEAVADAATGEFERLKEFGIRASSEGDRVTFTFRGMETTVRKSAEEIEGFLRNIGNVDFAGAMEARAQTLDGALSNLEDSIGAIARAFGDAGFTVAVKDAATFFATLSNNIADAIAQGEDAIPVFAALGRTISEQLFGTDEARLGNLVNRQLELQKFLRENPGVNQGARTQIEAELAEIESQIEVLNSLTSGARARAAAQAAVESSKPSSPGTTTGGDQKPTDNKAAEKAEERLQKAVLKTRELLIEQDAETAELNAKLAEDADELTRRLRDNQQDRVNNLVESLATEEEALQRKLQNDLQLLELAKANELQIIGGFEEAKKRLVEQNAAAVAELQQRQLDETANASQAAFEDLEDAVRGFGNEATQAIVDFATTGKLEVGQLVESILADFARMAVQRSITGPLFDALSGALGGGASGSGGIGSFFSGLFGGARAEGGPVSAGRAYLVGEQGPELVVPRSSGTVVPNGGMGAAPEVNVDIQIVNTSGADVSAQASQGADGRTLVRVAVRDALNDMNARGELDSVLRPFGARRQVPGR